MAARSRLSLLMTALVVVAAGCSSDSDVSREQVSGSPGYAAAVVESNPTLALGGLTVVGRGETTVPADGAVLVFAAGDEIDFDSIGQALSARDRQDLLDGLDALDIARDDVQVTTGTYFDGEQIRVRVPLERLPDIGAEVEEVLEDVTGRLDTKGVAFTVANCATKVAPGREQALAGAQHAAEALAKAAKTTLGELRAATEFPGDPAAVYLQDDPCDPERAGAGLEDLRAYDAKPEVELYYAISTTYALEEAGTGGLTVEGRAAASGEADRATVVVLPSLEFSTTTGASQAEANRHDITAALTELGIGESDIELNSNAGAFSPFPSGELTVAVTVDATKLPDLGEQIVDAVEDVLGNAGDHGVLFTSSDCATLAAEAQQQAVADAEQRITALAAASGVKAGPISRLVDATGAGISDTFLLAAGTDPCDPPLSAILDPTSGDAPVLQPLDADPVASVTATIVLTRAIATT